ncbi:MAG: M48 family metalloprotease [Gemmatimonadota bacterium]
MSDANLFAQQEQNRRRSVWLVVGFIVFFAWVGFGGDIGFYLLTANAARGSYRHTVPFIGLFTTIFAAGIAWYAWRRGPERVLWSTGAVEVLEPETDQQAQLVNVVDEMAIASGLPRPRIWIVPDVDPNAFATGRGPESGNIAVTQGTLDTLSRDELQAVVAHEMAHIRNYDVRLMTLLAAIVGAVALMSNGMGRMLGNGIGGRSGGGGGRKGNDRGGGAGALGIVIVVLWLLTLLVAPLVTRVLAMAVSRKREFLADATGAQFTRNPGALASALAKLAAASAPTTAIKQGAAHLCIVDPAATAVNERHGRVADLLASHPPIADRINRLNGMAFGA